MKTLNTSPSDVAYAKLDLANILSGKNLKTYFEHGDTPVTRLVDRLSHDDRVLLAELIQENHKIWITS